MASFAEIMGGIGMFSGGLAQGIQTGYEINNRARLTELQERQSNLQAISSFAEIMAPGVDPTVRKLALENIIPQLGLPPGDAEKMAESANKLDDESRASFLEFMENNPDVTSGTIPLKTLMTNYLKDPMGTMKFIQEDIDNRADRKLDEKKFGLDVQKEEHDVEQDAAELEVSKGNLNVNRAQVGLSAQRLKIEQQQETRLAGQAKDEMTAKGLVALGKAVENPDPGTRNVLVKQINEKFALGMPNEAIDDLANRPETYSEYADQIELGLKIEKNERENLGVDFEKRRVELAEQLATDTQAQQMITNRQKAIDALTTAAKIEDPQLRAAVVKLQNKALGLGLTPEQEAAFEVNPTDTMKLLKEKLEVEIKGLDKLKKEAGLGGTTTENKAFLDMRSNGVDHPDMPQWIKNSTPEAAKSALEVIEKSGKITVNLGPNLKTKSAYDKTITAVSELGGVERSMDRLIEIIEKNPEVAGLLGTASRFTRASVGAVTSLDPLVSGAKAEIRAAAMDADPNSRAMLNKIAFGPDIPRSEILETALRIRVSRVLSGTSRILKDDMAQAMQMINITGLVGDAPTVIERLKEVKLQLSGMKADKMELLGTMKTGDVTEEDVQDSTDLDSFLDEVQDPDEDSGEEEEE